VDSSPLDAHVASPGELRERIFAERLGTPFLVYRDGDDHQVILDLGLGPERRTVGRRPGNDVPLVWDAEVSRLHAELERAGELWTIADEGLSHNGTYVNGERLEGRRLLRDGDVIAVGGTAIAFRSPGDATHGGSTETAARPLAVLDLTAAQRRVLVALCRPLRDSAYAAPATNSEIAAELVLTTDTIKGTLRQLYEAFGIDDVPQGRKRATLAERALRSGTVTFREL
jgi:pSer/pThr/pTyr-binding forkhead associated (FHA) protein